MRQSTHINKYGTKHSEAIITENQENATSFLTLVMQQPFTIMHQQGSRMALNLVLVQKSVSVHKNYMLVVQWDLKALTSSKYFIHGNGQVRG